MKRRWMIGAAAALGLLPACYAHTEDELVSSRRPAPEPAAAAAQKTRPAKARR